MAFQQQVTIITIHKRKNDGLENYLKKKKKIFFFFLYFHIREVLSHSQECGSRAAFPGGSQMIWEGSHVCDIFCLFFFFKIFKYKFVMLKFDPVVNSRWRYTRPNNLPEKSKEMHKIVRPRRRKFIAFVIGWASNWHSTARKKVWVF